MSPPRSIDPEALATALLDGDRAALGRAITLVESQHPRHRAHADHLLRAALQSGRTAWRIGISGVPGVGKSTFIEAFGLWLLERGHRVAVLAVDPSSTVSGGSILGDKTRMNRLARDERAFIRPSPSAGTLGGVARKTREAMHLCEAAGYDIVLVETVGVGQSETTVADMVDFYLVLMLAGAGDELQGVKRGILELVDALVIHKADGHNVRNAQRAAHEYRRALHLMRPLHEAWTPRVLLASSLEGSGLEETWEAIHAQRQALEADGAWTRRREEQSVRWMRALVQERLLERFRRHEAVRDRLPDLEQEVRAGRLPAGQAAESLIEIFFGDPPRHAVP